MDLTDEQRSFLIAEYHELRTEIIKRVEIQHQLVTFALVGAGTFVTIGFEQKIPEIPLLFPILSLILAWHWGLNGTRIGELGVYIRDNIEAQFLRNGQGWEHIIRFTGSTYGLNSQQSALGIIVGTQIVAVTAAIFRAISPNTSPTPGTISPNNSLTTGTIIFILFDILIIVVTCLLLLDRLPRQPSLADSGRKP